MIEEIAGLLICLSPWPKITSYLFLNSRMHQILKSRRQSQEDVPHASMALAPGQKVSALFSTWGKSRSSSPTRKLNEGIFPPIGYLLAATFRGFAARCAQALLCLKPSWVWAPWPQTQPWPQTLLRVLDAQGGGDLLGDVRTEKTATCTSGTLFGRRFSNSSSAKAQ